MAVTLPSVPP